MCIFLVNRELSSLSELFLAAIYPTYEGLSSSMCVLMFLQVLRKHKSFLAMLALEFLRIEMYKVVPFEREFAREEFLALSDIALVKFSHY